MPPFTKVNFILITPGIDSGADLNLDCIFTSPGISQSLLIAHTSLSAALVGCMQGETALLPSEDPKRPLVDGQTWPQGGRLRSSLHQLNQLHWRAAIAPWTDSSSSGGMAMGTYGLWFPGMQQRWGGGAEPGTHLFPPQFRCLKPKIPGQQSGTIGTLQKRESLS